MEIPQMPFLVLILSMFIFIFSVLKLSIKHQRSYVNIPPGPRKLPVIGNILSLVGGSVPHRALRNLASKYGDVMHLQIGELSVVVISSQEAAKVVMKTHDVNFASRPSILAAEITNYGCTGIAFAPYGDYWRQLRKICTLELLNASRVQSFRWIREQVFHDLTKWIASKEGSSVNLTDKLYPATYSVVSIAALGKKTEEQEVLVSNLKEILHLASGFNIGDFYPSVKLLQWISGVGPRIEKLHRKSDTILETIIHEHKVANALKKNDEGDEHEDLVDVLLKFQDDRHEIPLTNDNIKAVINDVLGAGTETSATTMDWAMAEMLKNPKVLQKAQQEVRSIFDAKGYVDESSIDELKYLKCVVKETLRMHVPVPLLLPRKCSQKCEINGFEIPAGTKVIVNGWAINRDSKYWEHSECFKPERFLDSEVEYKGNNFEYIPFGAGRRICPGISFGIANVELPLAMFLYHFDWKLPAGLRREDMDMSDGFGITARREQDLWTVPILKRPLLTDCCELSRCLSIVTNRISQVL